MSKRFLRLVMLFSIYCLLLINPTAANESEQMGKYQSVRGSTFDPVIEKELVSIGDAPDYTAPVSLEKVSSPLHISAPLSKTQELDFYIPHKSSSALKFDHNTKSLHFIMPELEEPFSETVQAAINKAPNWLTHDLTILFSSLLPDYRTKWANAILYANDPYIDEIAFCVAHLSPDYLMSSYAYPQLLADNARLIYENDQFLHYVEVIDFGSSLSNPDYYSTTKYRKVHLMDTLEVQVPRDIYYWYVVHPKITDEIPAYIDPDIVENNYSHKNNITSPDQGYFWRDFLFNHSDPGYAKLKDLIKDVRIVWNKFGAGGFGAHAMEILNRWQGGCMDFTSNEERPHQPVRIYRKHIGRCGENSDMRVAVARSVLIPAAAVASYSTDHVWNEFWDERWIHWDGPIDDPYLYVNSWGKEFGSVFRWKSDGSLIPVTPGYTKEHSILNIFALDSLDNPIDGARVILYTTGLDGDNWFDTYGYTDAKGCVTFLVGTGRRYYARMSCDYGTVPKRSGDMLRVVGESLADYEYNKVMQIAAEKPVVNFQDAELPVYNNKSFFVELDFTVPSQIVRGHDLLDDLDVNALQFMKKKRGSSNVYILDESNYNLLQEGKDFSCIHSVTQSDSGFIGFEFDDSTDLYFVLDNSNSQHTIQHITGTAQLYSMTDPTIPNVYILQSYPNPMNPVEEASTITYQLPQKTFVEISVYNLLGQKVRTLLNREQYAGSFNVRWDGKDQNDQVVPAGVYFYRLKTKIGEHSQKMAIIH